MKKKNLDLIKKSESREQIAFVQWLKRTHPDHWPMAIPNGGGRTKAQGAILKAEGVSPGVPDLFIPSLHLWIEMKQPGGRVSKVQKEWQAYLVSVGFSVAICWSFEEAKVVFLDTLASFG